MNKEDPTVPPSLRSKRRGHCLFSLCGLPRKVAGFFREILISPRLIKIAMASRMSLSNSIGLTWSLHLPIEDCYGIPRTTHKGYAELKIAKNYENNGP